MTFCTRWGVAWLGVGLLSSCLAALGCDESKDLSTSSKGAAAKSAASASSHAANSRAPDSAASAPGSLADVGPAPFRDLPAGDAERGKVLVDKFECNRCHEDTGLEPVARNQHCTHCHQEILTGKFEAPKDVLARWSRRVAYVREVPSLQAADRRFRRDWLESFLLAPTDVRAHLAPTMPRLALSPADARDIAEYLVGSSAARIPAELSSAAASARLQEGRRLVDARGCGSCHVFSGAPPLTTTPDPKAGGAAAQRAVMLAPDLRETRRRFAPEQLVSWLVDPTAIKPNTPMPATGLTREQAVSVASYLLHAPLAPERTHAVPKRLPRLSRKITYAEVDEKVFRVTCRHCHGDADLALGDGGPGNTGGFGFRPKRLNLSSYTAINAGYVDANGERRSIFEPLGDGTPRLVAALLARQAEEVGKPNPEVRGMPLGLPSLTPEQIQLVDTWISQGRPR